MRTCWGSPRASPSAIRMPACSRRAASSPPAILGCAAQTKLAWLSATSKPRSRSAAISRGRSLADRLRRDGCAAREHVRSASSAPAWRDLRDAEVGLELATAALRSAGRRSRSRRAGRPGPRPWRSCGRRAGAGGRSSSSSEASTGSASTKSTQRLVEQHRRRARAVAVEQAIELGRGEQLAGRVVGVGQRDHAHARVARWPLRAARRRRR